MDLVAKLGSTNSSLLPGSSLSLWARDRFANQYVLLRYLPERTLLDQALQFDAESKESAQLGDLYARSPNDTFLEMSGQIQRAAGTTGAGAFLSLSSRIADPGQAEVLQEEIGRILEELQVLPGYVGAIYGSNAGLPEEVLGIVWWDTRDAFFSSLPKRSTYEVQLYERLT